MRLEARLWRVKKPAAYAWGTTLNLSHSGIAVTVTEGGEGFATGDRAAFEVCVSEDRLKGAEVLLTGVGTILRLERPASGGCVMVAKIVRARLMRRADSEGSVPFELWAGYHPVEPHGRHRDPSI